MYIYVYVYSNVLKFWFISEFAIIILFSFSESLNFAVTILYIACCFICNSLKYCNFC